MQNPQTKFRKSLYNACNDWQMSSSTDNNPVFIPTTLLYYSCEITLLKYAVWCANTSIWGKNNCGFLLSSLLHHFSLARSVYTPLALDSFGLNVCKSPLPGHRSFHPSTITWIIKKANVQEACFWQGFSPELKHRNTVYFLVLSLLLRGTYLIKLERIYLLFIRFS